MDGRRLPYFPRAIRKASTPGFPNIPSVIGMNPSALTNSETGADSWFLAGQLNDSDGIRIIPIPGLPSDVGRRSDARVCLTCNSVSKRHAEFFAIGDQLCLRDLGSTNGTFVNGRRLSDSHAVLAEGDLIQFATYVFRLGAGGKATEGHTIAEDTCDGALAMMQFDRLMTDGGFVPYFQRIVEVQSSQTIGYEVLGRSRLFGMHTPAEMFNAAAKLNQEAELSRNFRDLGIQQGMTLPGNPNIFVNTHPAELGDATLYKSLAELRAMAPDLPITLEIHEAAVTDARSIIEIRKMLTDLNMLLAFDDFGAGRARLVELSEVRPDFVKFDMNLTRDIHRAPEKRQEVVALIVKMVNDLGISSLAEGIEQKESHLVLQQMNVHYAQGFYYGVPAPIDSYCKES